MADIFVTPYGSSKYNVSEAIRFLGLEETSGWKIYEAQQKCKHPDFRYITAGSIVAHGLSICTYCGYSNFEDGHPE